MRVMQCLTIPETEALFGSAGYSVSLAEAWYRRQLVLRSGAADRQMRVGAGPPRDVIGLTSFIVQLNSWLPSNQRRLFWVSHWESGLGLHSTEAFIAAARRGLGEPRSLEDAPGHLFDAHPYDEMDQQLLSAEHLCDVGLLVGLVSLILLEQSDGWLIAEGCEDRIEFWEGYVFFHSANRAKQVEARKLLKRYDCKIWKR